MIYNFLSLRIGSWRTIRSLKRSRMLSQGLNRSWKEWGLPSWRKDSILQTWWWQSNKRMSWRLNLNVRRNFPTNLNSKNKFSRKKNERSLLKAWIIVCNVHLRQVYLFQLRVPLQLMITKMGHSARLTMTARLITEMEVSWVAASQRREL
jgi:hypothetical protein